MRTKIFAVVTATIGFVMGISLVQAEPAGSVVYAFGQVNVSDAAGHDRPVTRGQPILAGETLHTGNGRLQMHMADGGFVQVQPNTQFKVDEYHYAGTEDGSERSFFNLIKGGIRFISGAIGHRNKENFHIKTTVATIGIRGSAGRVDMCTGGSCRGRPDGVYVTGNQDTLTLTNDSGEVDINPGQTFHTECTTCNIQQVSQAPDAFAAVENGGKDKEGKEGEKDDSSDEQTAENNSDDQQEAMDEAASVEDLNQGEFTAGNERTSSGSVAAVSTSITGKYIAAIAGWSGSTELGFDVNDDGFPPKKVSGYDSSGFHEAQLGTATNHDTYNNGVLFLTRWSGGTYIDTVNDVPTTQTLASNQGLHFAYGTSADFPSTPAVGTATYALSAATAPTTASGSGAPGTVRSGSLTVNFMDSTIGGNPSASLAMSVNQGVGTYNVTTPSPMPIIVTPASDGGLNPFFAGSASAQNYYSSNCYSSCSVDVSGFLSGSTASSIGNVPSDAGVAYTINDSDPVSGAAAFHVNSVP